MVLFEIANLFKTWVLVVTLPRVNHCANLIDVNIIFHDCKFEHLLLLLHSNSNTVALLCQIELLLFLYLDYNANEAT